MSALLATASATFSFQGANVTLSCSSPTELLTALREFGIGNAAANDTGAPGKSKPTAATAPAGASAPPAAASSAPAAAAQAAQGDAGNAPAAAPQAATSAPTASSQPQGESPAVTFDELKKAFLELSKKADGRAKCEGVLKPFGLAKLSEAKPEQYAAVLGEIKKASE